MEGIEWQALALPLLSMSKEVWQQVRSIQLTSQSSWKKHPKNTFIHVYVLFFLKLFTYISSDQWYARPCGTSEWNTLCPWFCLKKKKQKPFVCISAKNVHFQGQLEKNLLSSTAKLSKSLNSSIICIHLVINRPWNFDICRSRK